MTRRQRLVNLGIALAIAVVAVIVIMATSGGSDDDTERPASATQTAAPPPSSAATPGASATSTPLPPPEITIEDGRPVGGPAKIRVKQGERIRFRVVSDVADHIHVHAYDIFRDVTPGEPVTFSFEATITGITEVELEDRGEPIASLRVDP